MHGKATLILTDKDTGRVVKQIEEHNMVTNALNRIFTLPPVLAYHSESRRFFNGFLPMYQNLLKGIILFGENVPELADNIIAGDKYSIIATAGDEYAGADAMRGSFNANQSCEIENGYRFVWDFAPEKAVGTIKCISLTHRLMGNRGDLRCAGAPSYFIINPSDLSDSNYNTDALLFRGEGTTFLQKGKNTFYSYVVESKAVRILKYRVNDPLALKICDKLLPVLESETQISLNLNAGLTSTAFCFDPISEKIYAVESASAMVNGIAHYRMRYAIINPFTCVNEYETDWIITEAKYRMSSYKTAIFGGKYYSCGPDNIISVCSLSGALEKEIDAGITNFYNFCIFNGKVAAECKLNENGRRCLYELENPKNLIHQPEILQRIIESNEIRYPYCYVSYTNLVNIMFRTDYLATINNLSTPLEKTDRHALQIRYEITN